MIFTSECSHLCFAVMGCLRYVRRESRHSQHLNSQEWHVLTYYGEGTRCFEIKGCSRAMYYNGYPDKLSLAPSGIYPKLPTAVLWPQIFTQSSGHVVFGSVAHGYCRLWHWQAPASRV